MAIVHDQIGSEQFIRLDGEVDVQRPVLSEITRKAVDGRAFRDEAEKCGDVVLQGTVDLASAAAAETKKTTYSNMVKTVVTIKKNGQDKTDYLVVAVRPVRIIAGASGQGGVNGGSWLLISRWVLTRAGVD